MKLLCTRDKDWCQIIMIKLIFLQDYSTASSAFSCPLSLILSSRFCRQLRRVGTTSWYPPSISLSRTSARLCKRRNSPNANRMLTPFLSSLRPIRVFIFRLPAPRLDVEINHDARTVTISTQGMSRRHQAVHYRLGTYVRN